MAHRKNSTQNRQIWQPQKVVPYKNATTYQKMPKVTLFAKDWAEWFLKGNSQICYINDSDSWSWDFKVEFSPLQSDIPITLLSLIVRVVGSW